jgi:hypothetical protein
VCPSRSKRASKAEPINPLEPVIAIRMVPSDSVLAVTKKRFT